MLSSGSFQGHYFKPKHFRHFIFFLATVIFVLFTMGMKALIFYKATLKCYIVKNGIEVN